MMESIKKLLNDDASLVDLEKSLLSRTGHSFIGDALNAIADEIEAEIAERYMLLPCDADGVPIHVGDRLTNINKPSDEYIVAGVNGEKLFVYGGHAFICASQCRHVRPRTIEDVLADFASKQHGITKEENDALIAECAEEIRELIEVDG